MLTATGLGDFKRRLRRCPGVQESLSLTTRHDGWSDRPGAVCLRMAVAGRELLPLLASRTGQWVVQNAGLERARL